MVDMEDLAGLVTLSEFLKSSQEMPVEGSAYLMIFSADPERGSMPGKGVQTSSIKLS